MIAAVIVTRDRPLLLSRCINALLAQSQPVDRVVVVDNASGPATSEVLRQLTVSHPQISVIRFDENIGGAGGFAAGARYACELGFDRIWLSDDDGWPDTNCLAELLAITDDLDIAGPAVVTEETGGSQLSWGLRELTPRGKFRLRKYVRTRATLVNRSVDGVYRGVAGFFNGVLIHRRVFEAVGFPNRELFMDGDEVEFWLRCRRAGISVGTGVRAVYFHPAGRSRGSDLKFYYGARNAYFIFRLYGRDMYGPVARSLYPLWLALKLMTLIPTRDPRFLVKVARAVKHAWQGELVPF